MRRDAGFTLLEIVAALAVFGILLVALSQGLQFGVRAGAIQARDNQRRQDIEAVDRSLRLLVRRIQPGDDRNPVAALQGTATALELLTQLPFAPGPVASRQISGALEVDAAHRLVLRWALSPHAAWLHGAPPPTDTVLLENVRSLDIAYWKDAAGGGGQWQRSWTETSPPSLVRMRITFGGEHPAVWPDIVVAPDLDHG